MRLFFDVVKPIGGCEIHYGITLEWIYDFWDLVRDTCNCYRFNDNRLKFLLFLNTIFTSSKMDD